MKQTAIVTGGSRGIGRAVAVRLAKDGMNLVINYRGNSAAAEETERLCRELGAEVLLVQGDVSRAEDCEKLAAQAKEAFGRVDVLVNNAGITRDGLLARMTEEDFRAVLDVNLVGPWNMMKAVNRIMMKQRYGRIVNLSSVTADGQYGTDELCGGQSWNPGHDEILRSGSGQPGNHGERRGTGFYRYGYDGGDAGRRQG
mgnify:FL=1